MSEAIAEEKAPTENGIGSAEHWKEKAEYWAGVAHRLRGEALRGEDVDGIVQPDAARWRRLVNASEMAFPVAAIVDDPENDAIKVYGRKRMEALIDGMDEIPCVYPE